MLDRVHADAIAEQRAAGLAPRRIDRDDRDLQPVVLVEPEAPDQLVGQRALARAAGAGDAERRRLARLGGAQHFVAQLRRHAARFEPGDEPRQRIARSPAFSAARSFGRSCARSASQAATISLIMPCSPSRWPSSGEKMRVTPYACSSSISAGHDHAAAAAEHLDVRAAALAQQVEHVLEELDVAALVGRDRDAVRVFLQRAVDDLVDRAVVAEVDHLAARRLQDAPHDVDRRVVAVEQARRGDEADLVRRLVDQRLLGDGDVVHHCSGGRIRVGRGVWRAVAAAGNPACAGLGPRRKAYSRRPAADIILRLRKRQSA